MADSGSISEDLLPRGEGLRRAIRWLSAQLRENPSVSRTKLVEEAGLRFDLSPLEVEFLMMNWRSAP